MISIVKIKILNILKKFSQSKNIIFEFDSVFFSFISFSIISNAIVINYDGFY